MTDGEIAALLRKRWRGEKRTYRKLADDYGVHHMDVWRAMHEEYVSPRLRRVFNPPRQRTRIICEVPDELKEWWDKEREKYADAATLFEIMKKSYQYLTHAANVPQESE